MDYFGGYLNNFGDLTQDTLIEKLKNTKRKLDDIKPLVLKNEHSVKPIIFLPNEIKESKHHVNMSFTMKIA